MSIFELLLRVANGQDKPARAELCARVLELARPRLLDYCRDDLAQDVIVKLLAPGRASMIVQSLVDDNPWLAPIVEAFPMLEGLEQSKRDAADRLAVGYIGSMVDNRQGDQFREENRERKRAKREREKAEPERNKAPDLPDEVYEPSTFDEPRLETREILNKLVEAAVQNARNPERMREDIQQVFDLAAGVRTTDQLVDEHLRNTMPGGVPDQRDRIRARNCLQQRHQHARDALIKAANTIAQGTLDPAEVVWTTHFVTRYLTRRRQNPQP